MTGPAVHEAWIGAGIFRPLLHRADLTTTPWRFGDWDGIWFAACHCPVTRLWSDTPAGRTRCPDCARLDTAATTQFAPIQRGPADA